MNLKKVKTKLISSSSFFFFFFFQLIIFFIFFFLVLQLVDEEEIAIDVETLYGYTALGLAASEGTESVNGEGKQVLAVEMLLDRPPGCIRPAINRETNGMTPL